MFFANASYFRDTLVGLIESAGSPVKTVIIDAESIHGLDTTATAMLRELQTELSESGIVLMLARAHGAVVDMLERSDLLKTIGEDRVFPSVRAGVAYYLSQTDDRSVDAAQVVIQDEQA
jgi:MFS superfamily sulfate permease-like transporter